MRRREFIAGLGSVAACPGAARTQARLPVIGFLASGSEFPPPLRSAFLKGLNETGHVEGRDFVIEIRFAQDELGRLPALATELVRLRAIVIVAPASEAAIRAAQAATTTIPVVFGVGGDPVEAGFVTSLGRPAANLTGFSELNTDTVSKRLEILRELTPRAARFALLVDPYNVPVSPSVVKALQTAVLTIGRQVEVLTAGADDIDAVFGSMARKEIDALLVSPSPMFYNRRAELVALAARHAVPAIYWDRAIVEAGGLISYGTRVDDMLRQLGNYAGRILGGEKPADLPVQQATKFELVINLTTARPLGLTVPETLLATADEVIQ
jgi:putative tryptophan/tyrosine transport system substrate-binding protein